MPAFPVFLLHKSGYTSVKLISRQCYIINTVFTEPKREEYYYYQVRHDAAEEVEALLYCQYFNRCEEADFERIRNRYLDYTLKLVQAIVGKTPLR